MRLEHSAEGCMSGVIRLRETAAKLMNLVSLMKLVSRRIDDDLGFQFREVKSVKFPFTAQSDWSDDLASHHLRKAST